MVYALPKWVVYDIVLLQNKLIVQLLAASPFFWLNIEPFNYPTIRLNHQNAAKKKTTSAAENKAKRATAAKVCDKDLMVSCVWIKQTGT